MKFAVCNEVFKDKSIAKAFDKIAEIGYDGVEIAPWTLGAPLNELDDATLSSGRQAAESAGLEIAGIHWIFGRETTFHILDPDKRNATLDILVRAVNVCGGLGGDVITFGSPWQRNRPEGVSETEALATAASLLGHDRMLNALTTSNVTFCFEPLSEDQTNFVNRATAALTLVEMIDHPNFGTMLDGYSFTWEEDSVDALIWNCAGHLRHFHADDETKRGPGQGNVDFKQIATSLAAIDYKGWMSIEAHDHTADLEGLAGDWLTYLRSCWS
jgi:sugar phosphate isomerase/epimerase